MELSVSFMSNVIGLLAILLYIAAPFLHEEKRAFYARILAEGLFALMFFYIGCLAGTIYYLVLMISAIFEKQIEKNHVFAMIYGIAGCILVWALNNNAIPGRVLAVSMILIFLPIDEQKMLTTTSFIDVITAIVLLYYTISVRSISGIIFAILLLIAAFSGLYSAVRLAKGGGLQAAAAEEELYRRDKAEKANLNKSHKKNKKRK